MKLRTLIAVSCVAVTAGVWLSGCHREKPGPLLAGTPPSSYEYPGADGRASTALPGIDRASYALATVQQPGSNAVVLFAVWVGEGGGGQFSFRNVPSRTPSSMRRDFDLEWTLGGVPVEFHTDDGVNGPVKIGNESFDLANGALFLVAKHDVKFEVKQMSIAKLDMKPAGTHTLEEMPTEYWRALAKTDPEIRAFWEAAAKTK